MTDLTPILSERLVLPVFPKERGDIAGFKHWKYRSLAMIASCSVKG